MGRNNHWCGSIKVIPRLLESSKRWKPWQMQTSVGLSVFPSFCTSPKACVNDSTYSEHESRIESQVSHSHLQSTSGMLLLQPPSALIMVLHFWYVDSSVHIELYRDWNNVEDRRFYQVIDMTMWIVHLYLIQWGCFFFNVQLVGPLFVSTLHQTG